MARISTFLIMAALIAGMAGCGPTPAPTPQYDLTITSTTGGSVTTPGEDTYTYDEGEVVNLEAIPDAGYQFVNWTGNVDTIADVNDTSTTTTMNDDYIITANFKPESEIDIVFNTVIGAQDPDWWFPQWIEELREIPGFNVTVYWVEQLTHYQDVYDSVISGQADMGLFYAAFNLGGLPAWEVFEQCNLTQHCEQQSRLAWEMYQESPVLKEELSEVKLIGVCIGGTGSIMTVGSPILTLNDWSGRIIGFQRPWVETKLELLGASPIGKQVFEQYELFQDGIIDGSIGDLLWLEEFMLADVIDYINDQLNFGYMPFYIVMNWDTWNSLSSMQQAALEALGGTYWADGWDSHIAERQVEVLQWAAAEHGVESYEVSPQELASWEEIVYPVRYDWVEYAIEKDIPAQDVQDLLDLFDEKFAEYASP